MKTAIVVEPVENLLKLLPVSECHGVLMFSIGRCAGMCCAFLELQAMLTNPLCLWDINDFASYFLRFSSFCLVSCGEQLCVELCVRTGLEFSGLSSNLFSLCARPLMNCAPSERGAIAWRLACSCSVRTNKINRYIYMQ